MSHSVEPAGLLPPTRARMPAPDASVAEPVAAAPEPAVQLQMAVGVEIGQLVRVSGKRGTFRVIGLRPGGIQLIDADQKWHVVRPERIRSMPPVGRARGPRPA